MRIQDFIPVLAIVVPALLPVSAPAQPPPDPFKVMITELSWGEPDGLELTNFAASPADLTGFRVVWRDAAGGSSTAPLGVVLGPGASLLVVEQSPLAIPELPPGVPVLALLPVLSTASESIAAALVNPQGTIIDDVLVTNTAGVAIPSLSGSFRGFARRGQILGSTSVERIRGLDSDGGRDWSEESNRSFGIENRSAGLRNGLDPVAIQSVRINEIDASPPLVELVNGSAAAVDLRDWYFLVSDAQGAPVRRVNPWPSASVLGIGRYAVLYEGLVPPAEMPGTALPASLPPAALFLGPSKLTLGLYDRLGRLVDLVRSVDEAGSVVHNHPRLPSWPFDFTGAAPRLLAGDRSFGRAPGAADTDTGADWRAIDIRTMGSANLAFVGPPGHADTLDVRLHEGQGDGLTAILNAGTSSAGHAYNILFSFGHLDGNGPFLGLGPDALSNWLALLSLPPFSGALDSRGSARFDFPAGSVPPGFQSDNLFITLAPGFVLSKRTLILEFDT